MSKAVLDALKSKFGDAVVATSNDYGDECATVKADKVVEIATFLRDDDKCKFDSPVFVTCIDRLGLSTGPRFEVCYQLRSLTKRQRVRLKVLVEEKTPKCPSLVSVWPGFDWQERETFDMYGIEFTGHPDLRRIYMYDEFIGYPLRKDYPKERRHPLVRREWTDE